MGSHENKHRVIFFSHKIKCTEKMAEQSQRRAFQCRHILSGGFEERQKFIVALLTKRLGAFHQSSPLKSFFLERESN